MITPRRTPRVPSMGLNSCHGFGRLVEPLLLVGEPDGGLLDAPAPRCEGRNSCSGGSSRRTVTGRPSMASRIATKSCPLGDPQLLERGGSSSAACRPGSCGARSAGGPRPGTCARSGTARCPRRRGCGRWRRRGRCRRWPARPGGPCGSRRPSRGWCRTPAAARPRSAAPRPSTTMPAAAVERDPVALVDTVTPPTVNERSPRCAATSAPTTAGLPQPRATTAAWLTRPPRAVRMPSAASMPCTSSGEVSLRTRITCSPRSAAAGGVVGGEVDAAHGGARARRRGPWRARVWPDPANWGCSTWSRCSSVIRVHRLLPG